MERRDNFIISRKEHIFQSWKEISQRNTHVLKRLAVCMTKHHQDLGFNRIRDANYLKYRENRIRRGLGRLFDHFHKAKYQDSFNLWKEGMYVGVNKKNQKMKELTGHSD